MTGDKSNFKFLDSYDGRTVIFSSDQRKNKIIDLDTLENQNIIMLNLYLIDFLNYNLLNASRLCDAGYYIKFDARSYYLMRYIDDDSLYTYERNIYYLIFVILNMMNYVSILQYLIHKG
jgi:hypothetical protein